VKCKNSVGGIALYGIGGKIFWRTL